MAALAWLSPNPEHSIDTIVPSNGLARRVASAMERHGENGKQATDAVGQMSR